MPPDPERAPRSMSTPEAFLWILGYQFAQGLVLIAFVAMLIVAAYGLDWPDQQQLIKLALELNLDRSFLLIGVTTLGALFLIVPVVRWRLGRNFRNEIGWQCPRRPDLIFATATIVPVAILGDALYDVASAWWGTLEVNWALASVVQTSSLEHLKRTFQGVPYPILVVAMALGPAIGEELVFRGMIGRGLVARIGAVRGTITASLLFALAHLSPPHVIATLPVAFLLQWLYLKTRTIWIPILVHFGNNLLAVSMIRFEFLPQADLSPLACVGFCIYLGVILVLLESFRRDWRPTAPPIASS